MTEYCNTFEKAKLRQTNSGGKTIDAQRIVDRSRQRAAACRPPLDIFMSRWRSKAVAGLYYGNAQRARKAPSADDQLMIIILAENSEK